MALGKVGFAGTVYGECCSPSVTLGEQVAECFRYFAECFGHSANSRSPVVMPKKEVPAAPLEGIKQKYLIIGPMKVLIEEIQESSVIENRVQSTIHKSRAKCCYK